MDNINATTLSATVTRPNNTDAYGIGDVIGTASTSVLKFTGASPLGAGLVIIGVSLQLSIAAVPSGMSNYRLHLYNAEPTAIADNAAFNLPSGDRAKYLGYISIPVPEDLGDTIRVQNDDLAKFLKVTDSAGAIYGVIETRGAYTPAAQTVYTVTIDVLRQS